MKAVTCQADLDHALRTIAPAVGHRSSHPILDCCLIQAAVCDTGTTTISFLTRTDVNRNAALVQNSGNTTTGNSRVAINDSTGTTDTLPVRIVDVVPETAIAGEPGSYTEVIVKWNFGVHRYYNATGV